MKVEIVGRHTLSKTWFFIEAIACGFLPSAVALLCLPWLFFLGLADLKTMSFEIVVLLCFSLAATAGLRQYWLLAVHTIRRQQHKFGREFKLTVFFGVLALMGLAVVTLPVAAITLPAVVAGWHFWRVQRGWTNDEAKET